MGFIFFVLAMGCIAVASTTKETRRDAGKMYDKFRWLWLVNIAIVLSFYIF